MAEQTTRAEKLYGSSSGGGPPEKFAGSMMDHMGENTPDDKLPTPDYEGLRQILSAHGHMHAHGHMQLRTRQEQPTRGVNVPASVRVSVIARRLQSPRTF